MFNHDGMYPLARWKRTIAVAIVRYIPPFIAIGLEKDANFLIFKTAFAQPVND